MKRFWDRLIYRAPGEPHNPLMYPFLLITLGMGIAFVFFPDTAPVQASVLYQLTIGHLPDASTSIWGVVAMVLALTHLIAIQVRKAWLGSIVTMTGVLLWLYASFIFGIYGYWLQFFTAGIPSLFFWCWYYFFVKKYHREESK